MKKKNFSLFILFFFAITLPIVSYILIQNNFELRISAFEDDTPRNVLISDIKDSSFKVSWLTEKKTIGSILIKGGVKYSEIDRTKFHTIEIKNLKSGGEYSFSIFSLDKEFFENGSYYKVRLAPIPISDSKFLVYGQVFSVDGYTVQQGGLISMYLKSGSLQSQKITTVINETGGYQFDLGSLYSSDLKNSFNYKLKSEAVFEIYTSHKDPKIERTYFVDFSTSRQIPNIYLGENSIDIIPGQSGI